MAKTEVRNAKFEINSQRRIPDGRELNSPRGHLQWLLRRIEVKFSPNARFLLTYGHEIEQENPTLPSSSVPAAT